MHPTQLAATGRRVGYLDDCLARGLWIDFYDPDGGKYGLPTYPYHWAPDGLLTIRQLRVKGLRPGGQPVVAQILWRRRKRLITAYLYRIDLAKPKRQATPAQQAAIGKALAALPHLRHRKGSYSASVSGLAFAVWTGLAGCGADEGFRGCIGRGGWRHAGQGC